MILIIVFGSVLHSYGSNDSLFQKGNVASFEKRSESKDTLSDRTNFGGGSFDIFNDNARNSEVTNNWVQSQSSVSGKLKQNIGGTNRFNSFSGILPGVFITQRGYMPGDEWSRLRVRGANSFGVSSAGPLVLVDGVETDANRLNPHTIERITVLKDAAATAQYGLRGGAGIILIETKRRDSDALQIDYNSQFSVIQPLSPPSFLGSYDYARLYNEALVNEGSSPRYSDEELELFRNGNDPFNYPNINWVEQFLREETFQTRNSLSLSGKEGSVGYFFSLGYLATDGLFETDENINTYNTNTNFNSATFHTNLAYKPSRNLKMDIDIKARRDSRRTPGEYDNFEDRFFSNLYNTPPLAMPVNNPDGTLAGTRDFRNNIYGELNHAGYSVWKRTVIDAQTDISYSLGDYIPGLEAKALMTYSNFADHIIDRSKEYAVYQIIGDSINQIGQNSSMANRSLFGINRENVHAELGFNYKTDLGQDNLSASLFAERRQLSSRGDRIPRRYQGVKGETSYNINQKYTLQFVFSYMGSDQFPSGSRYGFFPAIAAGWVVSNENFMQNIAFVDLLRLRASYGIVGNDYDSFSSNSPYFAYLENYQRGRGYNFGYSATWEQGFYEVSAINPSVVWESIEKTNIGMEAILFSNSLSLGADIFYEQSRDILILGSNPKITGYEFWFPYGLADNRGFEAYAAYRQRVGVLDFFVSSNVTYAQNLIVEQDEPEREYEWMKRTGNSMGAFYGYTFDRFFTQEDIGNENIPDHSFLGTLRPGDLIYKDLNGDGMIDERDISFIANPELPKFYFGLQTGFRWQGVDFSILLQGISGAENIFRNPWLFEFNDATGNVTEEHLNRWTEGSGQQAEYPRLSVNTGSGNRVNSTFWIRDVSYLRIKSMELGYTFEGAFMQSLRINTLRFYLSAYNLHTWSALDALDPEYLRNGSFYPATRYWSVGINLAF